MNFTELVKKRRSIRKYSEENIPGEIVEKILKVALMAPSSKNKKPWQFVVVEDKLVLQKLSSSKKIGSSPVKECKLAIVVCADPMASDVWIEDASIASIMLQLQAEDLGLGSCWIQIRNRETDSGQSSEEYVRDLLEIPLQLQILSIITLGYKAQDRAEFDEKNLQWEKIHIGKYKED